MIATVFVDYDNFRLRIPERTAQDVEFNLGALIRHLLDEVRNFGGIREVDIRLYGGWLDEVGSHTQCASWLLTSASSSRGRWNGLLVRPALIRSTIWRPDDELRGTFRSRAATPRQKMVDGMIILDLVYFAQNDSSRLLLISDDDDLVPGALAAAGLRRDAISWARLCSAGDRPNDSLCQSAQIRLCNLRRTP